MTNEAAVALGSKGGKAGTKAQSEARKRNIYIALARRFPNSPKIRAKLREAGIELKEGA